MRGSIEKSKNVTLQKLIYALGIRHIGMENAKLITDKVKSISNLFKIIKEKKFNEFLNIDGIGETQINSLDKYFSLQSNLKILYDLNEILHIEVKKIDSNGKLKEKTFMFTGKLDGISRAEAKSLIEKNSGNTVSSISKNLNYLVIGENPTKSKVDKAKNLNIKILNQKDLIKLLN